ncbi:DUF4843 domain-containing protein [Pedobacter nyackensis]|uniref:DUF4843 domain-containing protein n=1 Tax=Pedobacter nyackensis TaxID=475255 RepID=UPI00293074C7|nr:DUF4843 domain-containing protein [Pedobacter nyackensis]
MKMHKYFIVVIAIITLVSCKKNDYYLFNDVARLQFGPAISELYYAPYKLKDTTKTYTFVYEDNAVVQDTVFFDLYTIGGKSDKDRVFRLKQEQVPGVTNAIPGKHYKAFTASDMAHEYIIKAGQVHLSVPIVLLRDASLKATDVVLKFSVESNENFQLGEQSNIWRKVIFADRLIRPNLWDASGAQYYYGKYSRVKHEFMIEVTKQKWDNAFFEIFNADPAQRSYWLGVLKTALINYNNNHPEKPKVDEDDEALVFP